MRDNPKETKMSTKNTKRNLVVDDRMKSRKGRRKYKNETLLQLQRRKEKELLNQWKAERDNTKKTKLIVRKQAHDVSRREKERFIDETDYIEEDRYIWKHDGCNKECLEENCAEYIMEHLFSCYD
jgi:hypothetical protein